MTINHTVFVKIGEDLRGQLNVIIDEVETAHQDVRVLRESLEKAEAHLTKLKGSRDEVVYQIQHNNTMLDNMNYRDDQLSRYERDKELARIADK